MAQKIAFDKLKQSISHDRLPLELLHDYLEQDPSVSIPKLRVKPDAVIGAIPAAFDVDKEIFLMVKRLETAEAQAKTEIEGFDERPDVVAEGDSWFRHAPILFPVAIAQRIKRNRNFRINNMAFWGHTLSKMLKQRQYFTAIDGDKTEFLILSAGGNDLQDGITTYISDYDPTRPLEQYLTTQGEEALNRIEAEYRQILTEVTKEFKRLKIVCHGYDYPRPKNGSLFIGKYLERKGIPENLMTQVMNPVIDKLNASIQRATAPYSQTTFLDCRHSTDAHIWFDDMHPDSDGFRDLASRFENAMAVV